MTDPELLFYDSKSAFLTIFLRSHQAALWWSTVAVVATTLFTLSLTSYVDGTESAYLKVHIWAGRLRLTCAVCTHAGPYALALSWQTWIKAALWQVHLPPFMFVNNHPPLSRGKSSPSPTSLPPQSQLCNWWSTTTDCLSFLLASWISAP